MKVMNKKILVGISLIIQFCVIIFYYGYNKTIFDPPRSVHTWRQSDGASTGLHYYQYHNSLFKPMFHNMLEANGEAGSEFPVLYWLAAKLSPTNEFRGWYIRAICFSITAAFLIAINLVSFSILTSVVQATYTSMLLFTSTVFVFYAGNYLPDVPAVCCGLIGCAFMYLHYKNRSPFPLLLAIVFFSLGGLFKITSIVPYLTLLTICVYELLSSKTVFNKSILDDGKFLPILIIPFIISLAWVLYVKNYNEQFNSFYYRTAAIPIWDLDAEDLRTFGGAIFMRWFHEYFSVVTVKIAFIVSLVTVVIAWLKKWQHGASLLLLLLGSISVPILFSYQFVHHDYYMIVVLQVVVFFYLYFFYVVGKISHRNLGFVLSVGLLAYLLSDINYTKKNIDIRYSDSVFWEDKWTLKLLEQRNNLYKEGLSVNDKVVFVGDPSTCVGLYTLQTKGWTFLPRVSIRPYFDMYKQKGVKWAILLPDYKHFEFSNEIDSLQVKRKFEIDGGFGVLEI